MNCIPVYPSPAPCSKGSENWIAANWPNSARARPEFLPQMQHCTRCRADAVGLLGEAQSAGLVELLRTTAAGPANPNEQRPYVALASHEGVLIISTSVKPLVFGYSSHKPGGPPALVETRDAPEAGGGATRWHELAELLHDCKAVFTSAVGQTPRRILEQRGIRVVEAVGVASDAIAAWTPPASPAWNAEAVPGLRQGLRGPRNGLRLER